MSDTDARLTDTRIALLVAPRGTEEPEFARPRDALTSAGATVTVISTDSGSADTVNGDLDPGGSYDIDTVVGDVDASDFDAVVIPGGTVGADTLRADDGVVSFVRSMADQDKLVAAICHAPWVLIEAGLVDGRTLTSFPSLQTDIENAGGSWVDVEAQVDRGVITSRDPDDLDAFSDAIIDALST